MEEQYPSLLDRLQSTFIDCILLFIFILAFVGITDNYNPPDLVKMIFLSLLLAYEPLAISMGCTLGGYIKGIRVKSYSDTTKRINIFQAIIRYAIKILLGFFSFFTMHSNSKRRAIHDMISGSVMIKL
jgi:uncharacterized RDD family membrane protein YckC